MIAKYIQKGHAIWSYTEGFRMWEFATKFFMDMALFFVIIFFVLYLINQYREKRDQDTLTVDADRVAYRVSLAEEMYDTKYGPQAFRTNRQVSVWSVMTTWKHMNYEAALSILK